ncbi:MAG TPA: ABC transporter substrate-binding protein [Devosiaceae bacterium]|jgi:peptide/nickel transport system substrate-binding protein
MTTNPSDLLVGKGFEISRRGFMGGLLGAGALAMLPQQALAQAALQRGGTLICALEADPPTLSTAAASDFITLCMSGQLYPTLVIVDKDLQPQPALAKSWTISDDHLVYTFKLEEKAKWSDGTPLTSEDVRYTILDLKPKADVIADASLAAIDKIETPDDHTVVITLKNADPSFFPWALSLPNVSDIFPKHVFEGTVPRDNPAAFQPVSCGPFKFDSWDKGSAVTYVKDPDYFHADNVFIDRIVYQVIPDPGARQLALERGDVDLIPYFALSPSSADALASNPDVQVIPAIRPQAGVIMMLFNLRQEKLANADVRHAIAYAVDRKKIVDLALNGRALPGTGPIRSDNKIFFNPEIELYAPNVDKANELLDKAGFAKGADGMRFSLRVMYEAAGAGGATQSAVEIMREELKLIGIDLNPLPTDTATWVDTALQKWDFDLTIGSFPTGPDPRIGFSPRFLSSNIKPQAGANSGGYSNPDVDKLLNAADIEPDPAKRADLYKQAQKIIVDDLPVLWLWEAFYPIAARKGLVGVPPGCMQTEPFENVGFTA